MLKYIAGDLETTGLNPSNCQVIEMAFVLEDVNNPKPIHELPHFHTFIKHTLIIGEWEALQMNGGLLAQAQQYGLGPSDAWDALEKWLQGFGFSPENKVFVAGKNFGNFDLQFIPKRIREYFKHRFIDPGSVFIDWENGPASLGKFLDGEPAHEAMPDALAVVEALRKSYPQ